MTGKIFISYRRDDSSGEARSIRDRLARAFGARKIFMDVDELGPGEDFDAALKRALSQCSVFIPIIGPRWLELLEAKKRDGVRDFLAEEIEAALQRELAVIPVLVGRAILPSAEVVPENVSGILSYQAMRVGHERFGRDAGDLIEVLGSLLRSHLKGLNRIGDTVISSLRNIRAFFHLGALYWLIAWMFAQTPVPRYGCFLNLYNGSSLSRVRERRPLVEQVLDMAQEDCRLQGDTLGARVQDFIGMAISAGINNFLLGALLILLLLGSIHYAEAPRRWQKRVLGTTHWLAHIFMIVLVYILASHYATILGGWFAMMMFPYLGSIAAFLQTATYVFVIIACSTLMALFVEIAYHVLTGLSGFPHVSTEINLRQMARNWLDS